MYLKPSSALWLAAEVLFLVYGHHEALERADGMIMRVGEYLKMNLMSIEWMKAWRSVLRMQSHEEILKVPPKKPSKTL